MSEGQRPLITCVLVALLISACAPPSLFPREVLDNIDRTVSFKDLSASPDGYIDRIVELGGQIVESATGKEEVHMLVRELPIRSTPVYGPFDNGRLNGMFVIRYTRKIAAQDVQDGNMIIVIGTVTKRIPRVLSVPLSAG